MDNNDSDDEVYNVYKGKADPSLLQDMAALASSTKKLSLDNNSTIEPTLSSGSPKANISSESTENEELNGPSLSSRQSISAEVDDSTAEVRLGKKREREPESETDSSGPSPKRIKNFEKMDCEDDQPFEDDEKKKHDLIKDMKTLQEANTKLNKKILEAMEQLFGVYKHV